MSSADLLNRLAYASALSAEIANDLASRQTPTTALEHMRRSAVADLADELAELSALLNNIRPRLVFIGQVGVGKTTAICHLVGLTANRQKKKTTKTGVEKLLSVTEDMMATGSGFTTLCEVVVTPAEENVFEIEPYPRQEVERTIGDFCLSTWKRVYTDSSADGQKSGDQNFPPELVRAVRNMVKLPEGERRDDDAAVRLAREYAAENFDHFQSRVLSQAKLDGRTVTEFRCPSSESDARAWIKKTFDDLNLARLDNVSIPQRITLHVDRKLLTPQMARVAAVVDTKGVDAAQFNREDLDRHIRDDKNSICIFAEGFDTAPTNVAPLLQRHVTPEIPMSVSKFALMVIPRNGEPERKVGSQGPVGDRDLGISLLKSQIEQTLSSRGIRGLKVLCFDPLLHFESAGVDYRRRSESEPEEIDADRDEAWNGILDAIQLRQDKAWERIAQIGDSFQKISEGKGLNPAEENIVRRARATITEYRHISMANADRFLELYRRLWEGPGARHHMTLRATNNRFGYYPARNVDVFYDAVPITEQLVRIAVSPTKEAVLEIVRTVKNSSPKDSDLRELLAVLETRIDSSFEAMVREVGVAMQSYLRDTALSPQDGSSQFWINVQSHFGKGSNSYREDVLTMYADQMEGHESVLADFAEDAWQRTVIDPVLAYLAEG